MRIGQFFDMPERTIGSLCPGTEYKWYRHCYAGFTTFKTNFQKILVIIV